MEYFFFRKTVSPQPNNYTKKDTITVAFQWMYLCEYILFTLYLILY